MLGIWAFVSLWKLLTEQEDVFESWQYVKGAFSTDNLFWIILFFLLMLFNWWLEIRKWQILVKPYEKTSFRLAFIAVIGSLAFGIATPNRVGEYGFRALYLKPKNRKTGVMLTVLSSVAQLLFTLSGGILAALYWIYVYYTRNETQGFSYLLFLSFMILVLIGLILFVSFYKLTSTIRFFQRFSILRKFIPAVTDTEVITNYLRLRVLILSFIRYAVFLIQYAIIWQLFDAGISWQESIVSSAVIFLVMAFVPTIALAELGIRGRVSIWVAGLFSQNYLSLISGTTVIWVLNLFLPALCGAFFLWSFKIKKNDSVKTD